MNSLKKCINNRYDAEKSEYFMVRNELLSMFERQAKSETTLLSVYALILAYLLSEKSIDPISFLVPIPLVIFSYIRRYHMFLSIWHGAAYCIVYGYDYGFMWEKRLYEYRDVVNSAKEHAAKKLSKLTLIDFYNYVIFLIFFFLYIYKNEFKLLQLTCGIIILIILLVALLFRNKLGIYHYSIIFENEIEKWKNIKDKENVESKSD